MAESEIRYLPAAQDDLIAITDWIAQDSPIIAAGFVDELERRIALLSHHPHLGRLPRHPGLRAQGYRMLIVSSYLVFYIVKERIVEIHRVIHGSRHLDDIV